MKSIKILSAILVISIISMGCSQAINYSDESVNNESSSRLVSVGNFPFPQSRTDYNIVKPSNKTQTQLNNDVLAFYDYWKRQYLEPASTTLGSTQGYFVKADGTGGAPDSWNGHPYKSHSEATGYGMIVTALMGEQQYFDGLYVMFDSFRSPYHNDLMSWVIPQDESQAREKTHNATDADVDIAYALLLADNQWGSNGTFNYKAQALKTIAAVKEKNFNHTTMRATRGSWDPGSSSEKYSTRSSDWIVAEFQTFYEYTQDQFWLDAITEIYGIMDTIIANESPTTNLMPDFIEGIPARKATAPFLEAESDDDYAWNACRYPWRIGMGYGHFGDIRSKNALDGFVDWSITKCGGDIWSHKAGYQLDGTVMKVVNDDTGKHTSQDVDYSSNAYSSPLVLAASHDSKNQSFINTSWDIIKRMDDWNTFFGDTITLQCLLYISGNWWVPEGNVIPDTQRPSVPEDFSIHYDLATEYVHYNWEHSTDNVGVTKYQIHVKESWGSKYQYYINIDNSPTPVNTFKYSYPPSDTNYIDAHIRAWDAAGNESAYGSTVRIYLDGNGKPPTKPGKPVERIVSFNKVHFDWTPSTDEGRVVGYKIFWDGIYAYTNYSGLSTMFRDNFEAGTTYTFQLQAIDDSGNLSEKSDILTFTTPAIDNPPTKPTNVEFTKESIPGSTSTKVTVTFSPCTDDYSPVVYYKLYEKTETGLKWLNTNTSTYFVVNYPVNTTVQLVVGASDQGNQYSYSDPITVTTGGSGSTVPEDPAATGKPNSFQLQQTAWGGQSTYGIKADMYWGQNATVLKLYENGVLVETKKPSFNTPNAQTGIVFNFSNKPKGTYAYKLEAINQHGTTTSTLSYTVTQ